MYHEGDRKVLTRCGRNSSSMDIALTPTMFARRVREKCTALRRDAKDLSGMSDVLRVVLSIRELYLLESFQSVVVNAC